MHLEKLLGHVGAAALVDDIRCGKENLECDDEEDEEAHAGSGSGDSCGGICQSWELIYSQLGANLLLSK